MNLGRLASSLPSPIQAAVNPILRWWLCPSGPPPRVQIPQTTLLPTSRDLQWKKNPVEWPKELLGRRLVIVSASGGIDSTAAAIETRRCYPESMILLVRSDTGREPEDSEGILQQLSRFIEAPTITLLARNPLFDLCRWKGLIPNRQYGDWCTGDLKGSWLDRLNHALTLKRKKGTTGHTLGYLWGEGPEARRDRVTKHLREQKAKFGPQMKEFVILHELKIDKDAAIDRIRAAGLPISRVYLDRTRHGCIPCRWWDEKVWRAYRAADPAGFEEAAQLEDDLKKGALNPRSKHHRNPTTVPIALRTWLLPKVKGATKDDGRTLREWAAIWDASDELPPDLGIVRPEDLGEVDEAYHLVHLPSHRAGRRRR